MMDDFFQKQPHDPSTSTPKGRCASLWRCLFYTSIAGFISGSAFGYLHMKGWVPSAEGGLILYGMTFGIGAILSIAFVLYQSRQNQFKVEKIRNSRIPPSSRDK